jgi:flagellar biosynthesis protein FlhG
MADQAEALREIMKGNTQLASSKTRIITVASGKGGVGKTNLSTNIAIAYAKLGKRVVLMDADLGLANVNVVLGIIPKYNLYHLIRKQKTMKDILMDTQYGIQL